MLGFFGYVYMIICSFENEGDLYFFFMLGKFCCMDICLVYNLFKCV